MHEFSIAQALAERLDEIVRENNLTRIGTVNLRIGRIQAIVPESLRFALDVVLEGTPAEGATVNIEDVPCRIRCRKCGGEFEVDEWSLYCPECENGAVELIAGKELMFDSVEAE